MRAGPGAAAISAPRTLYSCFQPLFDRSSRPDDEVLEEFLGIMRPAITLVHRRRNSGAGGLSSSTSSSTSSTPVANSSVVKRPHPYRWNSLKRASSSLADSSHQHREERACARRKHRTPNSPKQLSPNYTVSVPPSPAFSDSSSAAVDLRSESYEYYA